MTNKRPKPEEIVSKLRQVDLEGGCTVILGSVGYLLLITSLRLGELSAIMPFRAFPAHLESLGDSHGCDFVIPS